jgi:hypothetical protein
MKTDQEKLLEQYRKRIVEVYEERKLAVKALRQVSFYASINHGDKCKDYGQVVDPVLKMLGQPTGEL